MKKIILFTALLVCFQANAITTSSFALDAKKSKIQEMIKKTMPELIVEEVSLSPITGIYQVIANNEIFYISEDSKYLLHGDLLDLTKAKTDFNLTEEVRKKNRLKMLATVTTKDMIIFSPIGKIKSFVTVFTDIDCVYCQRFHKEINKITELGIEVRYLAFPRQGIGSDSYKKSVSVWCADDPKNMITVATKGEQVPSKTCESPVARQYELGRKLHIQGTPTIVFADGTILASYLQAEVLVKLALEHQTQNIKITK